MTRKRRAPLTADSLRRLALSLDLPGVTEGISWGQPTLKTFGKVWFYWNPTHAAPVFKLGSEDERDMLIAAAPEVYFTTDHHRPYPLVLARPDKVDPDWVRENLIRVWRAQAPKKALKAYDEKAGA